MEGSVERLQQAYREERLARYEQVVALRKLGMSQAAIAKRVGIRLEFASQEWNRRSERSTHESFSNVWGMAGQDSRASRQRVLHAL